MVYRVLDVVREFFLGEGVPDWAARGVADQGQRSNVAYLEAAAVSLCVPELSLHGCNVCVVREL